MPKLTLKYEFSASNGVQYGDCFIIDDDACMVVQIESKIYQLISLSDGNRLSDRTNNLYGLTVDQVLSKISEGNCYNHIQYIPRNIYEIIVKGI